MPNTAPDPLTAGKAALEERDRVRSLARDARIILNRLEGNAPHPLAYLMTHGCFSWEEARTALEYIDWEDNRADGESDP